MLDNRFFQICLTVILAVLLGVLSVNEPIIALAISVSPFLLILLNINFFLVFIFIFSQVSVGFFTTFIPINYQFGTIDNLLKVALFIGLGIGFLYFGRKVKRTALQTNYVRVVGISLIYFVYASINATDLSSTFYGTKLLIPTLVFMVLTMYYDKIDWHKVYKLLVWFIVLNLIFSLYQFAFNSGAVSDIVRANGLTPSRNTFSMYLVFAFSFYLILTLLLNKKISFSVVGIILIMEFLSFGRAGWVLLGFSLFCVLIYFKKIKLLLSSLILTVLASTIFWEQISLRLESGIGTSGHREEMTSLLFYYFEKQPISGYGFGWTQRFLEANPYISGGLTQPHNDFIRLLVDTGAIGLSLFILPMIFIFIRAIKIMVTTNMKYVRGISFIVVLSVVHVLSFMSVYNTVDMYYASTMMLWIFAAIMEKENARNLTRVIKGERKSHA